jgi:hypothetical protein
MASGVTINMSWPKILTLAGAMVVSAGGAVWGIGTFWLESMDRNVGQLHDQFAQVMQQNGALQSAFGGTRADLIKDIADTRVTVQSFNGKLDVLATQIGYVAGDMKDMRAEIAGLRDAMK